MARNRRPSAQTRSVLEYLARDTSTWSYGYQISKETGIASGTLYPLLMRLADRGYLESRWDASAQAGRPPRRLCRLSETGDEYAAATLRSSPRSATKQLAGEFS